MQLINLLIINNGYRVAVVLKLTKIETKIETEIWPFRVKKTVSYN